jgi:hypothetical protein
MFGFTPGAHQEYVPLRNMPGMPGMPQQQTFQPAPGKIPQHENPLILKKKVGYLLVCVFIFVS